jgi:hypothetical protein
MAFCERKRKQEHLAYPNAYRKMSRFFHLVKPKAWDCKNIAGSHALHSLTSISLRNITLLKLQNLTCFHPKCMNDNLEFCENKSHVLPWVL